MEILFRGKRVDNGEWVYGMLCNVFKDGELELGLAIQVSDEFEMLAYPVIPETVGQYTGHDDKNGKKIFVGDFVLVKDGLRYGDNYECVGMILVEDIRTVGLEDHEELEVVGNIHDNPELLDG